MSYCIHKFRNQISQYTYVLHPSNMLGLPLTMILETVVKIMKQGAKKLFYDLIYRRIPFISCGL